MVRAEIIGIKDCSVEMVVNHTPVRIVFYPLAQTYKYSVVIDYDYPVTLEDEDDVMALLMKIAEGASATLNLVKIATALRGYRAICRLATKVLRGEVSPGDVLKSVFLSLTHRRYGFNADARRAIELAKKIAEAEPGDEEVRKYAEKIAGLDTWLLARALSL